jgi:(S)-2-hydroxyglutarate dehydrogenase
MGVPRTKQAGNSGVIHSEIYYDPKMARQGNVSTVVFFRRHNIEHDLCSKLIVASDASELPRLRSIINGSSKTHSPSLS